MTAALAFDAGLALLVLGVAVWTVAAGPTFAAVVGFVALACCWRSSGCVSPRWMWH